MRAGKVDKTSGGGILEPRTWDKNHREKASGGRGCIRSRRESSLGTKRPGHWKRFGTKGLLELVITDPILDIDDTSPRKNHVLGGSTELGRSGPNSGSFYIYRDLGSQNRKSSTGTIGGLYSLSGSLADHSVQG